MDRPNHLDGVGFEFPTEVMMGPNVQENIDISTNIYYSIVKTVGENNEFRKCKK